MVESMTEPEEGATENDVHVAYRSPTVARETVEVCVENVLDALLATYGLSAESGELILSGMISRRVKDRHLQRLKAQGDLG